MHNRGIRGSVTAIAAVAAIAVSASHADAQGWAVKSANGKCWTISQPQSLAQRGVERGPAYAAVQNSPADGVRGSFSAISGTGESAKGGATLEVDGKSFEVLPFDDAVFVKSGAPENALLAAMKKGSELKVVWNLPSGKTVTDTYSLNGFTSAKEKIDRDCR